MFSPRGVVQGDLWGRRTGSPSYSPYDGLPVRRANRTARTTDFQSVVQGDQNANTPLSLKQPPFCVCKHRIRPRSPSRSNSPRESLSWSQSRPWNPSLRSSNRSPKTDAYYEPLGSETQTLRPAIDKRRLAMMLDCCRKYFWFFCLAWPISSCAVPSSRYSFRHARRQVITRRFRNRSRGYLGCTLRRAPIETVLINPE